MKRDIPWIEIVMGPLSLAEAFESDPEEGRDLTREALLERMPNVDISELVSLSHEVADSLRQRR